MSIKIVIIFFWFKFKGNGYYYMNDLIVMLYVGYF